jgi:predicted choloylglycine hydrolase
MQLKNRQKIPLYPLVIFALMITGFLSAQEKVVELNFKKKPASDSDVTRTLQSLVKVRDISETYSTGGLYLLIHYGDRKELFRRENQRAIDHPFIDQTWRYCSLFSVKNKNGVFTGRNWDNQNVGSIIVNLYKPEGGYSSISFCRAIDMGFPLNVDLMDIKSSELGKKLLLAPFYAMDGINEKGLVVAVAGVRQVIVRPKKGKKSIFISFLIRKILDQTKSISEVLQLIDNHIPFDLDQNRLNSHFMVTESSGKSIILEYIDGQWQKIYPDKSWQVLTNKPVYSLTETALREKCWRFKNIACALEKTNSKVNWQSGMRILQDVNQRGTTWSVIYSPSKKELYFSVYQNWDLIYWIQNIF